MAKVVVAMTTIAWDGRMLAADTQETAAGHIRLQYRSHKLIELPDVFFVGCGPSSECARLEAWVRRGMKIEDAPQLEGEGQSAVVVNKRSRAVWTVTGRNTAVAVECHEPFMATGSGWEFAYAAMALGKNAREAVEFAARFDLFTSVPVDFIEIPDAVER